ncbi:maleylpyruvate isomerase N-terminal domain-containing protein [Mycobacterium sp. ITM-2016-00317]|uniref:maleylpyruvate isomerase family mycothiol-dependent enzyme n=1 Tax=Mycobacterium sp. ITM-2016-00317 TaxID=2099694 RepID=UPI000D46D26F|nr:maleylpyruvate isomerase family mycothiol-dependent enzyme [Mycobacterium sp. ITM-2016-00317]WNG86699.1 maleylpyruvate isomerase N-terminal domain-containing protein [Mycobacterium sp. ITM-2016-00317]
MTALGPQLVFASAADHFVGLVRQIPDAAWGDPGLGEWNVRDLVGHASRSLITVSTYLQAPAQREDVPDAVDYYVRMRSYASDMGEAAVVERGRQAGRGLGDDPAAAVETLAARVQAELAAVDDPLIEVIGGLGIRLSSYLPTRTFELAVHGLDIARAVGIDVEPPVEVLADAAALAARIGVALGQGPTALLALTGRTALPVGFSVV